MDQRIHFFVTHSQADLNPGEKIDGEFSIWLDFCIVWYIGSAKYTTTTGSENLGGPSIEIKEKMASEITCKVSPSPATKGSKVTISGNINPARSATVTILFYKEGALLETAKPIASDGVYSMDWFPDEAGSYRIEASWNGDSEYEAASSSFSLTVGDAPTIPGFPMEAIVIGTILAAAVLVRFKKSSMHYTIVHTAKK